MVLMRSLFSPNCTYRSSTNGSTFFSSCLTLSRMARATVAKLLSPKVAAAGCRASKIRRPGGCAQTAGRCAAMVVGARSTLQTSACPTLTAGQQAQTATARGCAEAAGTATLRAGPHRQADVPVRQLCCARATPGPSRPGPSRLAAGRAARSPPWLVRQKTAARRVSAAVSTRY